MNLHAMVEAFGQKWGPKGDAQWVEFLSDLRDLLEAYGVGALVHESLPDTEHAHADPVGEDPQLALSIYELGIPVRPMNALQYHSDIRTLGQLTASTEAELLRIKHLDKGSLLEIIYALAERGLKLKGPECAEARANRRAALG
jgi:DNA-directed RNA polymerase alpha subunit